MLRHTQNYAEIGRRDNSSSPDTRPATPRTIPFGGIPERLRFSACFDSVPAQVARRLSPRPCITFHWIFDTTCRVPPTWLCFLEGAASNRSRSRASAQTSLRRNRTLVELARYSPGSDMRREQRPATKDLPGLLMSERSRFSACIVPVPAQSLAGSPRPFRCSSSNT